MYKLIIVDDEFLSRYVLRALISKNFSNIEIVGEAENGRQAIELNRKLQPDLIIMDIKMPGINGIDASMEILREDLNSCILILTAYNNFEYVKQALDIGVKGYILKPVNEQEVVEKINKVLGQIDEKLNNCDLVEVIDAKLRAIKPYMENELVAAFMNGNCDITKAEDYMAFLQEEIKVGYFMLISPERINSRENNECISSRNIMEKTTAIVTRNLPLYKKCFFGKPQGNSIVVFIPVNEKSVHKEIVNESIIIAQDILRKLKVAGDVNASIGIGNAYKDIKNFRQSYNEAGLALRKASEQNSVIHFSSHCIEISSGTFHEYPLDLEGKLIDEIKAGNIINAKNLADEIITELIGNIYNMNILKSYAEELIFILKRTVFKMGIHLDNSLSMGMLLELVELTSVDEVEVWCKKNVDYIIEQIEKCPGRNSEIISKVFEYINRNFNKDITLESVANEVGLSSQYLSKIFKEKCGINFIDYITTKRLEFAENLLKNGVLNIKQVSKMSGYEDSNYFCRIFKKSTGLSPRQFRTNVLLQNLQQQS